MSVKVKVKNIGKEKLKKYERTLESKLKQIMSASGDLIRNEAIQSIMSGSKGGRTYEKYKQYYQKFGGQSITTINQEKFNQFFEQKVEQWKKATY